jgi:hypothetical protein
VGTMRRNVIIVGCMILGLFVSAHTVVAQVRYSYELTDGYGIRDSGYRSAVDMDDWLERGRASVTESPLFSEGVRLTAWAGEGGGTYEPGLASAIYYVTVPRWAHYLRISIRYKDAARDDTIAGRLWIKSTEEGIRGQIEPGAEAPFYGDTFILRSERESETITLPANRHVENATLEMHIVADGTDCIDVRDMRVEYLAATPQLTIVHRASDDYWNNWPRYRYAYHYYYWGPLFWPTSYGTFECWDVPQRFYWVTWRPWFRVFIKGLLSQARWTPRRYTVIYRDDVKYPASEKARLLHQRLRERQERATAVSYKPSATMETTRWPVQPHQPQKQEVPLKKEPSNNRSSETAVKQKPTQIRQDMQAIRTDRQREKTVVLTQTKTEKHQAVNGPGRRPSPPAPAEPQRKENDRMQTQTAGRQPRSSTSVREAMQTPARVQTPQDNRTIQEQKAHSPAAVGRAAAPQPRREAQQQPSYNEVRTRQPQPAGPQPQSRPVIKEVVQTPTGVHVTQSGGVRQGQMPQGGMPRLRQQTQPQPSKAAPQPRPFVREAAQAPATTQTPQVRGTRQEPRAQQTVIVGQQDKSQPSQEAQQQANGGVKDHR